MANTTLRGFRWVKTKNGTGQMPLLPAFVASAYGTVLCKGDPIKMVSDGSVAQAAAGDTTILGIMHSVKQYWDGTYIQRGNNLPVSTWGSDLTRTSLIRYIPVAGQIFEVDCDDGTTAVLESTFMTYIDENCDHVIESVTGASGACLDISTHGSATANWRILGISKRVDQDFTASRVKLLVECNESNAVSYSTTGT